MSDASPSPEPAPHVVGQGYEFDEVRAFLGGDPKPPNFVIHKAGAVIGVCLGLGWNPRADGEPCEVWVGRKGDQPKWGIKLAETRMPDGARLTLHTHDGSFCIRLDGRDLMHSMTAASELLLGDLALAPFARTPSPRVLIGGLGLGQKAGRLLACGF